MPTAYPTAGQAAALAKTAAALASTEHYGKRIRVIVDEQAHEFQTATAAARFLSGCFADWTTIRPFRNMNGQGTIDLDRDALAEDAERAANLAEAIAAATPPKPEKVGDFRGAKTYRFGKWLVTVTTKTRHTRQGMGLRSSESFTDWTAIDRETNEKNQGGYGGIRAAVAKLSTL